MFDLWGRRLFMELDPKLSTLARLYAAAMRCPLETVTGHHVRMMAKPRGWEANTLTLSRCLVAC